MSNSNPYREPSVMQMPYRAPWLEEKKSKTMTEEEMWVHSWKTIVVGVIAAVSIISISSVATSLHADYTNLQIRQLEASESGRAAVQARSIEARAFADKAMFEMMMRREDHPK